MRTFGCRGVALPWLIKQHKSATLKKEASNRKVPPETHICIAYRSFSPQHGRWAGCHSFTEWLTPNHQSTQRPWRRSLFSTAQIKRKPRSQDKRLRAIPNSHFYPHPSFLSACRLLTCPSLIYLPLGTVTRGSGWNLPLWMAQPFTTLYVIYLMEVEELLLAIRTQTLSFTI